MSESVGKDVERGGERKMMTREREREGEKQCRKQGKSKGSIKIGSPPTMIM